MTRRTPARGTGKPAARKGRSVTASVRTRSTRVDGASTQDRILGVAERMFARHGFDGVSTKQLASEAEVAIGNLYHHFPSKEAVYEAVTRRAFEAKSALPKRLMTSDDPPERKLAQLVTWFVGSILMDRTFGQLLKREMLDPRPSTPHLLDEGLFQQPLMLFKEQVRAIAPKANTDEVVASMLALIFGFSSLKGIYALFPAVQKTLDTPEEIAQHVTNLMLRSLRP
ncbi:MAG: TetR/AcrR family transcriptional regulator [Steroidobacteraceae bacterium]